MIKTLTAPSVLYVNSKSYGTAYTTTWTVPTVKFSEGFDYESAIGASDVESLKTALNQGDIAGKRIILAPGTYDVTDAVAVGGVNANLYINKSLTLQAADPNDKPTITAILAGNILKQSVICIDASDVTLDGLVIKTTGEYRNKAVEVCYETEPASPTESKTITNVVIRNCVIGNENTDKAAVYLGQKNIGTYTLENNHLKEMLVIANGAGNAMTSGESASVKNNKLDSGIRISGTRNTGWDKFNVENIPSITGNTIGTYRNAGNDYDIFISSCSQDKTKIIPAEKLRSIYKQNTFSGNAKIVDYELTSEINTKPYASNYTSIVKGDFEVTLTGPSSLSPNVEAIYSVTTNAADTDGITYRWQIDGVTIPDFTGPSVKYTFTNTDTVNTKQCTLRVTASQGTTQVSKDQTVMVDKTKKIAGDVPAADPITPVASGSTEKGTVDQIVFAQSDVKSGETPTATVNVLGTSDQKYTDYKESIPAASSVSLVVEISTTNLVKSSDLDAMAVLALNVPAIDGQSLNSYKVYHKKNNGNIEPLAFVPGYPKIQDSKVVLQVLVGGFSDIIVATVNAPVPDTKPVYSSSSGNTENSFRVLFETSGGSFIQPATGLSYGDRIAKPADPERDGYSFAGWYKDSAGTIAWVFSEDAVPGDTSLYAKWVPAGSSVSATEKSTEKATAAATTVTTAKQTTAPTTVAATAAATAPAGISPTMTQAPVPLAGLLLGLLGGCVLIRRKE